MMQQQSIERRVRSAQRSRERGFTLIEMLVVIVIIAILAAILFPVFASVRENARRTACASNLKQLSMAFIQYAGDYNERLPGATDGGSGSPYYNGEDNYGGWNFYDVFGVGDTEPKFEPIKGSIYPYVRATGVYMCPNDDEGEISGNSYAVNGCVMRQYPASTPPVPPGNPDWQFRAGKKLSSFNNTTMWMVLGEEARPPGDVTKSTDDGFLNLKNPSDAEAFNNTLVQRHTEGGNVAFLDGHVKWYKLTDIKANKFQIGGSGDLALGCSQAPAPPPPPPSP